MMEPEWDFGETPENTTHHKSQQAHSHLSQHDGIAAALQGLHHRLDTLRSINEANILIPGDPQEQYHQIVEEAYVVLGRIETEVNALRQELEYQHQRLDSASDAALAEALRESE